ncbi:hypothetical protein V1J52_14415 [Streptomyces sp. TRM 70351]|uniref:hypothetical protein n=1 Tax=Streptomyces sp. TRM 70351 TaxID=3116552 RepID=UPI002E7B9CD3|nr:hypothetical protein [Streptomyces sp. TRM 70351]MEE1929360.1 hypothetical protein [Streptomyces sp. TRM 70351]
MIVISLILLLAAVVVAALSGAALYAVRGLRREVAGLRADLAAGVRAADAVVPGARSVPAREELRAAVSDALAAERERELAEARAFWAAQEAHNGGGDAQAPYAPHSDYAVDAVDAALLDALLDEVTAPVESAPVLPRQPDRETPREPGAAPEAPHAGAEPGDAPQDGGERADVPRGGTGAGQDDAAAARAAAEAAGRAAARRRHPSDPHHTLTGEPVVPGQGRAGREGAEEGERTVARLAAVAEAGTELADVRPGPLGTLDVYVFADGTTVCLSPGHRDTAERLAESLRRGRPPVLLGGSGISGGYALTFSCGNETVYVLADRVIASL